jgi:hypothetical protein
MGKLEAKKENDVVQKLGTTHNNERPFFTKSVPASIP